MKISTHQYKKKLEKLLGWADPVLVKNYAIARQKYLEEKQNGEHNQPCNCSGKENKDAGKSFEKYNEVESMIELVGKVRAAQKNRGEKIDIFNDPNCKSCKKNFVDLIDKHQGQTCYIIGKGPSVDKWIGSGKPVADSAITIGINSIADHIKFDYAVLERPDLMNPIDGQYVFFTTKTGNKREFQQKGWRYFPHRDDPQRTRERLSWSKEQLAASGEFYSASSTVQHAIHLAWLMGCSDIVLIGIDGGSGYSGLITNQKPDTGKKYKMLRADTEIVLNTLFHGNWKDMFKPMKHKPRKKKKRQ